MAEAVLYSFRRCPYAMRARMALKISDAKYQHREVVLRDKPAAMLEASPKGTVPVLVLPDGSVFEESLEIMHWALAQDDPEGWLDRKDDDLVAANDGPFKHGLDRYKYHTRYEDVDSEAHRELCIAHVARLEERLADQPFLSGQARGFTDIAIFPFVRQFANHDAGRFEVENLPRTRAWLDGLTGSELFAAIMAKFPKWEPGEA
ncbi:glutathione S-transferase [Qipengyuania gaetbuli]|uniref:glutathione S-transferase n=1 Tax=Qipengyuania gaetbuli TaxID=266952 RepID=UPI001CFE4E96|nr:glutathione S-transferase [Qipengyuania gaetbuli]